MTGQLATYGFFSAGSALIAAGHKQRAAAMREKRRRTQAFLSSQEGFPHAFRLLRPPLAAPLLHLEQDGIPVVKPLEVDAVIRRTWDPIYAGNPLSGLTLDDFVAKYREYVFVADEYWLPPVDPDNFAFAVHAAADSAPSGDHIRNKHFALLPEWGRCAVATMLNNIEEGDLWPDDLCHGISSFVLKPGGSSLNPLDFRPLLLLPVLYRRWASLRLWQLRHWIRTWEA